MRFDLLNDIGAPGKTAMATPPKAHDHAFDAFALAVRHYSRALETLTYQDPALAKAKAILAATRSTWLALAPFRPTGPGHGDPHSNVVSLAGKRK